MRKALYITAAVLILTALAYVFLVRPYWRERDAAYQAEKARDKAEYERKTEALNAKLTALALTVRDVTERNAELDKANSQSRAVIASLTAEIRAIRAERDRVTAELQRDRAKLKDMADTQIATRAAEVLRQAYPATVPAPEFRVDGTGEFRFAANRPAVETSAEAGLEVLSARKQITGYERELAGEKRATAEAVAIAGRSEQKAAGNETKYLQAQGALDSSLGKTADCEMQLGKEERRVKTLERRVWWQSKEKWIYGAAGVVITWLAVRK